MSPRVDGMPEGHPEKRPLKLATLTLYAAFDDQDNVLGVSGELTIGPIPPVLATDETTAQVIQMMHRSLDSKTQMTAVLPAPSCSCGRCGTEGGGRS